VVFPRLYAIVDVDIAVRGGWAPRDLARAFVAGGARLLQLRAKRLESGAYLDLARDVVADASQTDARVIVNDRADVARLAGAAGIHVGQDDLDPKDVRRVVGVEMLVGLSTHSTAQIADALVQPISYFAVGPVFGTQTKETGYDRVGLALVREAAQHAAGKLPIVAIGGITLDTAASVIQAGATSVAVITDLLVGDPESRVREYLSVLS
jgi:thiamine-phosphate pyrophosphorylase